MSIVTQLKRCSKCKREKETEEFCKHSGMKDGLQSYCKECARQVSKQWHAEHPDYARQWAKEHPDAVANATRRWKKKHPDVVRARNSRHRAKSYDRVRRAIKRWEQSHKDHVNEYHKQWRAKNPDRSHAMINRANRSRRAKLNGSSGSYSDQEWMDLCSLYNNRCLCCGKTGDLTSDHVVPLADGGNSDISNIQPLCKSCNSSKGVLHTDYRLEAT